jgi:hypothetical protein
MKDELLILAGMGGEEDKEKGFTTEDTEGPQRSRRSVGRVGQFIFG